MRLSPLAKLIAVALLAAGIGPVPLVAADPLSLVMVEQDGCAWCARWNAEIGPIYPQTAEGAAAPLRRIDLHAPMPEDLVFESRPRLTPTFILTDDGQEVARIEGYAGDEFFWVMVSAMIASATRSE